MPAIRKCRGCGADVPVNAPFGHCPKCLLDLGFGPLPDETVDSSSAEPGGSRTFGEYELLEQLGRGGMGVVYKARQVALNRPVALKMITAGEFASPILIQRFHREAEAAANLHHPNIVPIYETGEIHGQHYLSMALIDGVGLDEYTKRGGAEGGLPNKGARSVSRMRQEDIARLLAKVARAVDHAHQHGVLHRDLKPGNILVDQKGEPHLTDFGVAKVLGRGDSSLTASGSIMGTPSYMAPEQAAGQSKHITTAADVYSLGAILYALLTGVPPFRGDTPVETLRLVVEQEPKPPSTLREGIDSDLATIAMKCLEKEPQRRYSSAVALAEDLERWSRNEPIQARSIHPTERFWRWCRRNPKVAAFATATIALLVIIAVGSTLAAYHFALAQKETEEARKLAEGTNQQLKRKVTDDLSELWQGVSSTPVIVDSETRAALAGRATATNSLPRLNIGVYTHTKPISMLTRYSPILDYLEKNADLRIDLHIYRGYSNATEALVSGKIHLARPGPAAYVLTRKADPGVKVLVKQLHGGRPVIRGLIFTSDLRISDLTNLNGRKFVFGDPESTFGNVLPKLKLMEAGIYAKNLMACCTHINAHDAVVEAVVSGRFEAGAANANYVEKAIEEGARLKILSEMQSISFPWVTSSRLDPVVRGRIESSLLKLKENAILHVLDRDLDGFATANSGDYDEFERNMEKEMFFGR